LKAFALGILILLTEGVQNGVSIDVDNIHANGRIPEKHGDQILVLPLVACVVKCGPTIHILCIRVDLWIVNALHQQLQIALFNCLEVRGGILDAPCCGLLLLGEKIQPGVDFAVILLGSICNRNPFIVFCVKRQQAHDRDGSSADHCL